LEKVTVWLAEVDPTAVAGKVSDVGEKAASMGVEAVRATDCGELVALSVAVRVVEAAPATSGLKARARVQLAPAAREVPQVFVEMMNSAALVPLNLKELTVIEAEPVLVKVTVSFVDVAPTGVVGKVRVVGEKLAFIADGAEPESTAF
jgi:hypothetical protein